MASRWTDLLIALLVFLIIPSTGLAQPTLNNRVTALETALGQIQNSINSLQAEASVMRNEISALQSGLANLPEDSVGNIQLQERIEVGDSEKHGEFLVKDRNGRKVFGAGISICAECHITADLPRLSVGESSFPVNVEATGRLFLRDTAGVNTIGLEGASGNAWQLSSANGFVKAWAIVKGKDGAVLDCFKCNRENSRRLEKGTYLIDFSPFAGNLMGRPIIAQLYLSGKESKAAFHLVSINAGNHSQALMLTYNSRINSEDCDYFYMVIF